MPATLTRDVVILGGGLAGLTVANVLGDRAVVVEREARPGGLVRSQRIGDYWFDDVIHVLYFADSGTEERIRALMGSTLQSVHPLAYVETARGTTRYPLQLHLSDLDAVTVRRCVKDIAEISFAPKGEPPRNFRDVLLRSFGPTLCELFFFPYNEKMWKRPLDTLAPSGFQWNIACPDLDEVLEGATSTRFARAYNAAGWYPRPASGPRGMELLSQALAAQARDIRLQSRATSIDPERREVIVESNGAHSRFAYETLCCSTLPLPLTVAACTNAPDDLRESTATLTRNRVLTVAFAIRGPRPAHSGWWRYYADPNVIFTRLVFMHHFDPGSAPDDGWVLMAEVTQRAEDAFDEAAIVAQVRADVDAVGAIPAGSEIVGERLLLIDPAYVVFSLDNREIVERAKTFLRANDVEPLGRYGRWEYSSMAQVMRDSYAFAEEAQRRIAARQACSPR
ncbi:MAG TPA: FAD-dependent oxidoreductase [Thermoanaerobaculia bacterium]|jgi:protoporphyrinogen oxidase